MVSMLKGRIVACLPVSQHILTEGTLNSVVKTSKVETSPGKVHRRYSIMVRPSCVGHQSGLLGLQALLGITVASFTLSASNAPIVFSGFCFDNEMRVQFWHFYFDLAEIQQQKLYHCFLGSNLLNPVGPIFIWGPGSLAARGTDRPTPLSAADLYWPSRFTGSGVHQAMNWIPKELDPCVIVCVLTCFWG